MFFSICLAPDQRFPNHHQHGDLWLNFDNGWNKTNVDNWHKGYADNFCEIVCGHDKLDIKHSQPRSFPLWYGDQIITNLPGLDVLTQAWADDSVSINLHGDVTATKIDIDLTVPNKVLTTAEAVTQIKNMLTRSVRDLDSSNTDNLKLYCSGGLDTILLYAMLSNQHIDFELLENEYFDLDEFTCKNHEALKTFWAYKQIHHWKKTTWLATGSCGDEYFLRGPAVIGMLSAWHNINFLELLDQCPNAYHFKYFSLEKNRDVFLHAWNTRHQLRAHYTSLDSLHQQIINNLLNDHQHWHLGQTLTWTPFKNIEITKILLQVQIQDLLPQFLDGHISKTLIQHFDHNALKFLSGYKNHNNRQKLCDLFAWHEKNYNVSAH